MLLNDLKYSLRTLAKKPGFALVVVLTLALGIGANTTIFTVVNAYLLRPLPFNDPERLVSLTDMQPPNDRTPASYPEFEDWRKGNQVFTDVACQFPTSLNLIGHREPERVSWASRSHRTIFRCWVCNRSPAAHFAPTNISPERTPSS